MKTTDALIAGWTAHTPAPVKFRELTEHARALEAEKAKLREALLTIANLRKDGELDDDGEEFDLTNDDAVDSFHSCINMARDVLGIKDPEAT